MIGLALSALTGWRGCAFASVVALAVGFGGGWKVRGLIANEAALNQVRNQAKAAEQARKIERSSVEAAAAVGSQVEARSAAVRTVTRTIVERVPVHVSSDADAHCVVPAGFVRVHDAAVAGVPPTSAGSDEPDEAASGIELSAVARTVAGNYGACRDAVEMVTGWQDFYRRLQVGRGEAQ